MAAILEISLEKYPPDFNDCQLFFGVNRHPKGIESRGFIYVPIFSRLRASSMRLLRVCQWYLVILRVCQWYLVILRVCQCYLVILRVCQCYLVTLLPCYLRVLSITFKEIQSDPYLVSHQYHHWTASCQNIQIVTCLWMWLQYSSTRRVSELNSKLPQGLSM